MTLDYTKINFFSDEYSNLTDWAKHFKRDYANHPDSLVLVSKVHKQIVRDYEKIQSNLLAITEEINAARFIQKSGFESGWSWTATCVQVDNEFYQVKDNCVGVFRYRDDKPLYKLATSVSVLN